jgi:hypothetical protein
LLIKFEKLPEAQRALEELDTIMNMHEADKQLLMTKFSGPFRGLELQVASACLSIDSNLSRSSSEKKSSQLKKRNLKLHEHNKT